MNIRLQPPLVEVVYPDSDGKPMAENTTQYRWIVTIKGNLDIVFRDRADVFVAGDNLIYPKPGDPTVCQAPDVYVAFGRPKGDRGSYKVWEEGDIFPQVVFEVLSPNNTRSEMTKKRKFYRRHGAEEYYVYDPDEGNLEAWTRRSGRWEEEDELNGFVSPRLGIKFDTSGQELVLFRPDGEPFRNHVELSQLAEAEKARADAEKARADMERERADAERERADRLAARLRALGQDPDAA